jgi:hypothetical protein
MTHQRIALAIRCTAKREKAGAAVLGQPEAGNRVALPVTDGPAPEGKKSLKCWMSWSGRRDSNPRPQPWQSARDNFASLFESTP